MDFSIEGNDIRFGLSSIKGIADSALTKLINFRVEGASKFQMFQSARQAGLGCGVMASLIMSGALDEFTKVESGDTRSKLSFECLLFSKLKDKEKLYCIQHGAQYGNDLIELIKRINDWTDNSGKRIARATRLNTLRKDTKKYQEIYANNKKYEELSKYWWEKSLLGFSYSTSLKQIFNKTRPELINLEEFKQLEPKTGGLVVCQVSEIHTSKSKKGNPYLKLIVNDETVSEFRLYFCGKSFDNYKLSGAKLPQENDLIACKIVRNDDSNSAFVEKLAIQEVKIFTKMADIRESESDNTDEVIPMVAARPIDEAQTQFKLT